MSTPSDPSATLSPAQNADLAAVFLQLSPTAGKLAERRARNYFRFGEQDLPDGTRASERAVQAATNARQQCEFETRMGTLTYLTVLREEFKEVACEADEARLIEELIDVAAVALDWIECIERRRARRGGEIKAAS